MQKVILKRLLQLIPTLLVVITFTFAATRLIPGDPVAAMLGEQYDATKVDALREELGLNDPIPVQFGHYLVDILHGDFGDSYYFNTSAMNMIKARLPNTLMLSVTSLCIAILVGVFFGVISARRQSSILDYALTVISLFGVSAPVFWVAIMMVLLFSVNLGVAAQLRYGHHRPGRLCGISPPHRPALRVPGGDPHGHLHADHPLEHDRLPGQRFRPRPAGPRRQ